MAFTPLDGTPSAPPTSSFTPLSTPPASVAPVAPAVAATPKSDPFNPFPTTSSPNPFGEQAQESIAQIKQPFEEKAAGKSFTPLTAAEGALSVGSGIASLATTPLAPVFKIISSGIQALGTHLANAPFIRDFGKDTASLPGQTTPERILTDIANAANAGMAILGGGEALKGEPALTPESAAQNYHQQVITPAKAAGTPTILSSDGIKDLTGDYAPENHPIYSQATKQLFEQEVPQNPHPTVKFTAGGPGSGKTDFLLPSMSKDFNGVIYDSTLSDYKTLQDRLATTKAAGKTPHVYGIVPDTAVARHFADVRGEQTGRVIPQDFFDKTHKGVVDTLHTALTNGDLTPEQVHLLDTRNMTDPAAIRDLVANNRYHTDPLALLNEVRYNKSNGQTPSSNELVTGGRNEPLPVPRESGANQGQPRNDTRAGNGVLQPARSSIGRSIEAKAVEAKLTQGFDKTAGYDPLTIKDQAARATKLINESPDDARAVLRGEKPLPDGLRGTALITAAEESLKAHPDPTLAHELANSPLVSATSHAAQEMRLMSERVPDSLTAKFQEAKAAREANLEKRGGVKKLTEKIVKEEQPKLQKEISRTASKRPTWESFINEISCRV